MVSQKRFDVDIDGDVTVVRLKDSKLHEIILITEFHDEILEYIDQHRPKNMIVDFATVAHCSSAVINSLLLARKRLMTEGGRIKLCGMHKPIRDTFRILRLDGTVFDIYESLPEARSAFSETNAD